MVTKVRSMIGRGTSRLAVLLAGVCLATLMPLGASAYTWSFGVINPGDVISSLTFNTDATNKITYNGTTLWMQGYLTQINFTNRAPIGGTDLPAGVVMFNSSMSLVPGTFQVQENATNNPLTATAGFADGVLLDLSIFDTGCVGTAAECTLLAADWIGNLAYSFQEAGAVTNAQLTGSLGVLSGNTDFVDAFGAYGEIDSNLSGITSDGAGVGGNLCNLVKANATIYSNSAFPASNVACGPGYALDDFTIAGNWTIIPLAIPEPGSALLLGLGLLGVAVLRRK